ncbi:MAG: hypothetical protein HY785_14160 [Oscillatoriophycideae cyanobacterium NC_groundwater_1537_Pr4_S-0.65um_50_18]|nr:hypothetical protein [Oscillatoriophycideae cyanobacterium NC_groundwater_1537_Pr4_S-0.65um_50_18]
MILKRLGIGKKSEYFLEAEPLSADETKAHTEAKVAAVPAKAPDAPAADAPAAAVSTPAKAKPTEAKPAEAKQKKLKKTKAADEPKASAPAPAPKAAPAPKPEPTVVNFATDYLLTIGTPRRRPGPSLDSFKDMAKQVNPRK